MKLTLDQWNRLKGRVLASISSPWELVSHPNRYQGEVPGLGVVTVDHYYHYLIRVGQQWIEVEDYDMHNDLRELHIAVAAGDPQALDKKEAREKAERESREKAYKQEQASILANLSD